MQFDKKCWSMSFMFQKKGNEPKKYFAWKKKVRCDKKIDNLSSTFKSSEEYEKNWS